MMKSEKKNLSKPEHVASSPKVKAEFSSINSPQKNIPTTTRNLTNTNNTTNIKIQKQLLTAAVIDSSLPEEDLKYKLSIRVYGKDENRKESHSFILDDHFSGVSSVIGEVIINIRTVTLRELRPIIEFNKANEMNKRSMLFQEALFIMDRLPNLYDRPRSDIRKYIFGLIHKQNKADFRLIPEEDEDKTIAELIGVVDYFSYDMCIVPLSQLPPA